MEVPKLIMQGYLPHLIFNDEVDLKKMFKDGAIELNRLTQPGYVIFEMNAKRENPIRIECPGVCIWTSNEKMEDAIKKSDKSAAASLLRIKSVVFTYTVEEFIDDMIFKRMGTSEHKKFLR
jgi:hypothetical protein